jgi:regulator of protease activity HflC (stomatin/prohibitin superfamily)
MVLGGIALIGLVSFIGSGGGLRRIDAGEVGVKFNGLNGGTASIEQPRFDWYMPWERLIRYPSSLLTNSFVRAANEGDRQGDDSIQALTKSGTIVRLDISVSWRVQAGSLGLVFQNFGERDPQFIGRSYIRPLTNAAANEVVGKMGVEEALVQKRSQLSGLIQERLSAVMSEYGITVEDVNVGEVYPDPKVREAIDRLVKARNQLQLLTKEEQTARETARAIVTDAERQAEESRLFGQLDEQAIKARRLEIRRIRAERWNGSEAVVGQKPPRG